MAWFCARSNKIILLMQVERLRLSRSKKTGGSKGYAFIEFQTAEDTKIVAESMDKYLLAGKQLVVKQLPVSKLHSSMWKGADEKFSTYNFRQQHADRVNKVR
jgi:nucleolar protein 15